MFGEWSNAHKDAEVSVRSNKITNKFTISMRVGSKGLHKDIDLKDFFSIKDDFLIKRQIEKLLDEMYETIIFANAKT